MLRFTVLAVTIGLACSSPQGCPLTEAPPADDQTLPPRDQLTTTATASRDTAAAGQRVILSATVADSQQPATVRYAWLQTAGPGVQIEDADQAVASFAAPSLASQKTLRFMVTTCDGAGAVGRAEVSVVVIADPNYGQPASSPSRPVADAGEDLRTLPGREVMLDGSGSTGQGLSYRWRQVSGKHVQLSSTDTVTTTFQAPEYDPNDTNILLFELAVTDSNGRTVTDRVQVKVRNPRLSDRQVLVQTTMGDFTLELEPEKAPVTVENFLEYVDDGFYDGTIFHRVIPGFVIQGGGFRPGLTPKKPRDPIVNEADNGLSNVRGTIAMALTSDPQTQQCMPDSATCQFFINLADNTEGGDGQNNLDPGGLSCPEGYTVFGRVIDGMDVVDEIAQVRTTTQQGAQNVPVEDVIITMMSRVELPRQAPGGPHVVTPSGVVQERQ